MDTNLNAYYDQDPAKNQRGIMVCNASTVDDCYKKRYYGEMGSCPYFDYEFKNLKRIKLSKTKMYLGRKS